MLRRVHPAPGMPVTSGSSSAPCAREPNSVGFYEKLGGRYVRDSDPTSWGRVLPVMGVDL